MRLSRFMRLYDNNGYYLLFNTITKSLVKIYNEYVCDGVLTNDFLEKYGPTLSEMGFFISEKDANDLIANKLCKDDKLIISVEVGLSCNMRCPYCYQGEDKTNKEVLSEENIALLSKYLEIANRHKKFSRVVLKVLGGEPTVSWITAEKVIQSVIDFSKKYNKKIDLMIDTNGVFVDPIMKLEGYDSLLLTIPLSYKEFHDKMRKLVNGKGSYEQIIENVKQIIKTKPETTIVLRHNTDEANINYFAEYVEDISREIARSALIDISYTTELGDNKYENPLKYEDYRDWKSTIAIDVLINHDLPIMVSPLMSVDRCQNRSLYSLKLFSDGTIGECAMDFFKNNRYKLSEICDDIGIMERAHKEQEKKYEKCQHCKSFFLCAGSYYLPCVQSLVYRGCEADGLVLVDVEKFVSKYVKYKESGKAELFVGFNQNKVIR